MRLLAIAALLFLFFMLFQVDIVSDASAGDENLVRARIGIQIRSGDKAFRAKSRDSIKKGDLLRIYVHPEHPSYIYVVHSDQHTATLLNEVAQRKVGATLVMPSLAEYYQVDGKSDRETFTIICSPDRLNDLKAFETSSQMSHDQWQKRKGELAERGRLNFDAGVEKPFAIAGNVRGAGTLRGDDSFIEKLMIYSGNSLLLKSYEFTVQN